MNNFTESVLDAVRFAARQAGSIRKLAEALDMNANTISRWLSGDRSPSVIEAAKIMERIGAKLVMPSAEPARDVCFVDAKVAPVVEGAQAPEEEDYLAVPLVEEVGAGPGLIPQGKLLSWFLVWKHQKTIRHKRDLIAVQLGRQSTSMLPTLKPEDIVLVDRQDKDVEHPGRIMLVMDPDGAGVIKRVSIQHDPKKRDSQLTLYSDNAANHPPKVYSLREDYGGDIEKAIVGRVVWAWSDVTER